MDKKERFAFSFPIAVHEEEGRTEVLDAIGGTDDEMVNQLIDEIEKETGSPVLRLTPEQTRMTANRFYFSSSRWNAPWQPTGPKPPGNQKLN